MEKKLVYDVHERPVFSKMLIFALQQVLAILAATIAVPTIIGLPTQIPAAILGAGIGTLVYQLFTKFKSPVFLGSSFAFLGSLFTAVAYGYCGIILGSVVAGLAYVLIAVVIHFVGTDWVNKLMPPVIIGPTVAIIGLSLAGTAMGDIVKASGAKETFFNPGTLQVESLYGSYNLVALLCGLVAFATIVICSTQKKYKMPRLIPFIIGIGVGYVVAAIFTFIGNAFDLDYLRIINFDPLINNFVDSKGDFVGFAAFISLPDFALIEAFKEIADGSVKLDGGAVVEVIVAFLPVALVVFAEHIADHKNLSSIIGKDLIADPGLEKTLLGDGVGSIAGTVFGICPNTTYGESVGCVAITRNASVATITTTAIMCIVLSFVSPIMALLQTIPACVMGGVCLTLYGFIAVSGLKMFKHLDLENNKNLFVVSSILIAGIGGLSIQIPYAIAENGAISATITVTSIATALIIGILTNFILTKIENSKLGVDPEETAEETALETVASEETEEACEPVAETEEV
ncbi:MAG: uracil-xanthine permease [Clostridia bacterium]|nr:uracil-xanthine permease [Clostridia bacterium]